MNKKEFFEIVALVLAFILMCAWVVIPDDYLYANAYSSNTVSQGSTSGNSTSGNSTSRNSTSRNSTSQNSTSRNSTSRNSTSQNSTSRNSTENHSTGWNWPIIIPRPRQEKTFTDVSKDAYYYDAVKWAIENKITEGTSDTTFSPNEPCKRRDIIVFLYRMAGSPKIGNAKIPFEDVPDDAYYYDALVWAYTNHITSGTSGTTFSPDDECTRGQIVTLLYQMKSPETTVSENPFSDVENTAFYAEAVKWAYSEGVTSGTSKTTFSPDDDCLRCQAVTFLYRFSKLK